MEKTETDKIKTIIKESDFQDITILRRLLEENAIYIIDTDRYIGLIYGNPEIVSVTQRKYSEMGKQLYGINVKNDIAILNDIALSLLLKIIYSGLKFENHYNKDKPDVKLNNQTLSDYMDKKESKWKKQKLI